MLYIGGEGRSGSTVLASLLGSRTDYFPVGEIRGLWQAIETNEFCGCGEPFSDCEFWSAVGDETFGGWNQVDLARMLELDRRFVRHRAILRLLIPWLRRRNELELREFTAILGAIYQAVSRISACSVIVDSTKDPPYAFVLLQIARIDLRLIHLVRDSRGVAYSWAKSQVERPEYANHPTLRNTFMGRRTAWQSALEWDAKNLLLHLLGRSGAPRMLVRYEAIASNPAAAIRTIVAFISSQPVNDPSGSATKHDVFEALPHHTLGGNRVRFKRGPLKIRPDVEWRSSMPRRQQALVGALTLPLLLAYGYVRKP